MEPLDFDCVGQATVMLGDEFDDVLRGRLMDALRQLAAVPSGAPDRSVAGPQELETLDVLIGGRRLHIVAETYIGLTISGPVDLVQQVQRLVDR